MHSSRIRTVCCSGCLMAEGCLPRGVSALGGVYPGGVHPPWTEFLTHACENCTFLQVVFAYGKNYKLVWLPRIADSYTLRLIAKVSGI